MSVRSMGMWYMGVIVLIIEVVLYLIPTGEKPPPAFLMIIQL